ncbi:unnamed protein product [Hymenolepis diminuta]|uniref:Uncharacterized protein n=2 Tax=Hymenolepis diminuta TaxID=6216 RepID=A0A564YVA5_HYMDI|nr:unnamed protein product [Hymenolepis diminuta]
MHSIISGYNSCAIFQKFCLIFAVSTGFVVAFVCYDIETMIYVWPASDVDAPVSFFPHLNRPPEG